MSYKKREGTEITDFWPDDTDTELYLASDRGYSMAELLQAAVDKWPEATLANISIASKYIHTHCVYYDRHDPGDYTDFLVLEYSKS